MTNEHNAPWTSITSDGTVTFREFMGHVLDTFPFATVDEDNDGQLVVNTGLRATDGGNVVRMDD